MFRRNTVDVCCRSGSQTVLTLCFRGVTWNWLETCFSWFTCRELKRIRTTESKIMVYDNSLQRPITMQSLNHVFIVILGNYQLLFTV